MKRLATVIILSLVFFLGVAGFFKVARASEEHNIRGLAKTDDFGYISFNCLDDDAANHFPYTFPFQFGIAPCSLSQHGVNLDFNNNFSGYAWNPSLGFINFGVTTTPPDNYAFNAHCQKTCNLSNNCSACYNDEDQRIYGWARAEDGTWIELNSALVPEVAMTNYLAPQPGIFSGYASSSFGSIKFNCATTPSTCGTEDYWVYLWRLEFKEMSAPNWSFSEACYSSARKAVFKWLRRGGVQTAYQVMINTSNTTSSQVFDSGKQISGSASQLVCPGPACAFIPAYNTPYYWWVRLWDENDEATEFFQFDTTTNGVLTDNVAANQATSPNPTLTFTTYKHEFPTPYFNWDPLDILVGTSTYFTSNSSYYNSGGGPAQSCAGGGCQFDWTSSDDAIIYTPTNSTTTIIFTNNHSQTVSLKVTDADQYYCSTSSPALTINFALPLWKEVRAQ